MQRILIRRGSCKVYINTAAILFSIYLILSGHGGLLLTAYPCILLHEAAHMAAAYLSGLKPVELEITPLGAMMRLPAQNTSRGKRLCILFAGPAATFLLCLFSIRCAQNGSISIHTCRSLFMTNASILMINLLPCLPLDGGSIVTLLLSGFLPESTVGRIMRVLGYAVGSILVLFAFYCGLAGTGLNLSLIFSGFMLIYASHTATVPETLRILKSCMERKTTIEQRGLLRIEMIAVLENVTAMHALRMLHDRRYTLFTVLESGTQRMIGTLKEDEIISTALSTPEVTCGILLQKRCNMVCNP